MPCSRLTLSALSKDKGLGRLTGQLYHRAGAQNQVCLVKNAVRFSSVVFCLV